MEMIVGLAAEDYRDGVMPEEQQYMICALVYDAHPNFTVFLWGLATGFKRYRVSVPIINECVSAAKSGSVVVG